MKVEIKNLAGETFPIEIFPEGTSHNLKARVFSDSQINFDFHELKLNGTAVKAGDCILDYFCEGEDHSSYELQNYEKENFKIPSVQCAVEDCKSTKESCPDKTFFPFPNSIDRFQHWLLVCKRDDLLDEPITVVNEKYAVCADHFLANQFTDSLRKILKKNVVPSQFHKSNNEFLELLEGDEIIIEEHTEGSITEEEKNLNLSHECLQFECGERSESSDDYSREVFEHPGQLCRLCANITTEFKYIFDDTGKQEHLAKKINSCLPVTVNVSDPLPKQLCSACELKLKMCFEFSETCMLAEDKLNKLNTKKSFRSSTSEANFSLNDISKKQNPSNAKIISSNQTIDRYHKEGKCALLLNYCCPLCCNGNMSVQSLQFKIHSKLNENSAEAGANNEFDSSDTDNLSVESQLRGKNACLYDSRKSFSYPDNENCDNTTHKGEHKCDQVENINSIIKCMLCSTGFDSFHACLSHSEFHFSANHYPCSLCKSEFSCEELLETHMEKHKLDILNTHKLAKILMCNICGKKFNSEKSMENHLCNILPRPHKCTECGKFFQTELRLLFHMQIHQGGDPMVCTICGKQFSRENNLFDHVRLVHMGEKAHCCDQCGKTFQLKARLIAHQRVHTGERPFECNICGGKFYDKATLKGHKVTHMNIKPFQCDKCGRCFCRKTLFNQHILTHLSDEKPTRIFPCKICSSVTFSTYARLVEHKKEVHPEVEIIEHAGRNQISKPFKCDDCGKSFAYRVTLLAHRRNHTGELPFQCEFCQKRFSQKRSLILHRRTHTGEKPFECTVCGKKFVQSAHLYAHQRLHTGEKPYLCEVCGTSFRLKEVRDAHERKHTGEKPYKCKFCEKTFRTSHSYYQHMWIHEGKKPYCCEYCGKAFRRSNGLKVHMRVHTGERPHICDICGRSFSQKQTMKKHKNLHLKDKRKYINLDVTE